MSRPIKAVVNFLGKRSGHCVELGKGGLEIMGGEGWFGKWRRSGRGSAVARCGCGSVNGSITGGCCES